ncbi:MAG TPA: SRPBCC domain-containing protein [Myxococcota bacterium]|nr:SRPBCC domain-containing protein [Myxococcota bacterium]
MQSSPTTRILFSSGLRLPLPKAAHRDDMGRSEIRTEIEIAAPPATVWAVLADFASYRRWNPMVVAADGDVQSGGRARLRYRSSLGVELGFAVRITRADPGRELRWVGRRLAIRGEHSFRLEPIGAGTRLVHGEVFTGALAGVLGFLFRGQIPVFERFDRALRDEAERRSGVP